MKLLLSPSVIHHVFSVEFPTEEGKVKNKDLPLEDQVSAEISLASPSARERFLNSKTDKDGNMTMAMRYHDCCRKNCKSIAGMKDHGIIDGETLVKHAPTEETNEMIREIALVALGLYKDPDAPNDDDEEEVSS